MKKSILNIGKVLTNDEKKTINGGYIFDCRRFCRSSPAMQQMQIERYGAGAFASCPCMPPC